MANTRRDFKIDTAKATKKIAYLNTIISVIQELVKGEKSGYTIATEYGVREQLVSYYANSIRK